MDKLQELLDREAHLANTGKEDSIERRHLHTMIRLMRDESQRPECFGDDDCSILMLSVCPWRIDCGK